MRPKIYKTLPDINDLVMFTKEVLDTLTVEHDSHFSRYCGHQLRVLDVRRHSNVTSSVVTFLSIPLNVKDIISLEPDGTVAGPSSQAMREAVVFQGWMSDESEPKNNDGRMECFWCSGTKTQKRGGGRYDVCPKCGR